MKPLNASSRVGVRRSIWNALTLNSQLDENRQSDRRMQRTAFTIVMVAALSRALGNAIISLLNRVTLPVFLTTLFLGIFSVVIGYYFWTLTIWKVGQWLKLNSPPYRELLYPIGLAYSPQILNVITLLPLLGRPIELIFAGWTLLAVTVSVRRVMMITMLQAALISLACFPVIQIVPIVIQVVAQQFTTNSSALTVGN
jgi:hypothetical protein